MENDNKLDQKMNNSVSKISKPAPSSSSSSLSKLKPFSCPYCPYRTKTSHQLVTHTRTHTGEKPYSCEFNCGYRAATAGQLSRHRLIHNIEKRYSCAVSGCDYKTNINATLRRHTIKHHTPCTEQNQQQQQPNVESNSLKNTSSSPLTSSTNARKNNNSKVKRRRQRQSPKSLLPRLQIAVPPPIILSSTPIRRRKRRITSPPLLHLPPPISCSITSRIPIIQPQVPLLSILPSSSFISSSSTLVTMNQVMATIANDNNSAKLSALQQQHPKPKRVRKVPKKLLQQEQEQQSMTKSQVQINKKSIKSKRAKKIPINIELTKHIESTNNFNISNKKNNEMMTTSSLKVRKRRAPSRSTVKNKRNKRARKNINKAANMNVNDNSLKESNNIYIQNDQSKSLALLSSTSAAASSSSTANTTTSEIPPSYVQYETTVKLETSDVSNIKNPPPTLKPKRKRKAKSDKNNNTNTNNIAVNDCQAVVPISPLSSFPVQKEENNNKPEEEEEEINIEDLEDGTWLYQCTKCDFCTETEFHLGRHISKNSQNSRVMSYLQLCSSDGYRIKMLKPLSPPAVKEEVIKKEETGTESSVKIENTIDIPENNNSFVKSETVKTENDNNNNDSNNNSSPKQNSNLKTNQSNDKSPLKKKPQNIKSTMNNKQNKNLKNQSNDKSPSNNSTTQNNKSNPKDIIQISNSISTSPPLKNNIPNNNNSSNKSPVKDNTQNNSNTSNQSPEKIETEINETPCTNVEEYKCMETQCTTFDELKTPNVFDTTSNNNLETPTNMDTSKNKDHDSIGPQRSVADDIISDIQTPTSPLNEFEVMDTATYEQLILTTTNDNEMEFIDSKNGTNISMEIEIDVSNVNETCPEDDYEQAPLLSPQVVVFPDSPDSSMSETEIEDETHDKSEYHQCKACSFSTSDPIELAIHLLNIHSLPRVRVKRILICSVDNNIWDYSKDCGS